ncbi:flavodoxin family protein [Actinomadura sp. 6N118]|uniref:flavodoxin family protein n=1 Tax=Actinomadura sp. 6N118 TaxID=3375151 RepID=UPI003790D0A5
MRAVVINCTLKRSPEQSNTEALAAVVIEELRERKVEVETIRAVDLNIPPGVNTDDDGRPVLYNRVAGVVVTGNEDGAHHVINNLSGALNEFGYTIPGQAWTYWNKGPGPGPSFLETDEGRDWSITTGRAMASNLVAVATALAERPVPAPPS